jgi:histidyl-tRNA synthetase
LRKGILDVCVIPVEAESRTQGVALLVQLRRAGIAADICVDNRSIKSAMKVANNTNAPLVLIIGPDELETQSVIIKEMSSGDQQSVLAEPTTLIPQLQEMLSTLREEQS